MKNILFITSTPTTHGNGDTLIEAAMEAAKAQGGNVTRMNIRDMEIRPCRACYGCAKTGVCVQKDDFLELLSAIHSADGIVAEAPVYYNCMAAQALLAINRLCCTFACKSYQIGPKKKVAVMLTCTGSEPEEMKRHVKNILTLPSINRAITAYRTDVFTDCVSKTSCLEREDYLSSARALGAWAVQE